MTNPKLVSVREFREDTLWKHIIWRLMEPCHSHGHCLQQQLYSNNTTWIRCVRLLTRKGNAKESWHQMASANKWINLCYLWTIDTNVMEQSNRLTETKLNHQIQGNLGVALGSLWGPFGVTLGSFWNHFGVTLGSFLNPAGCCRRPEHEVGTICSHLDNFKPCLHEPCNHESFPAATYLHEPPSPWCGCSPWCGRSPS